jgi:hypothetical protein
MPSSVIRERFYDASTSRLTITFVTGRIYVYEDVPPEVAADFVPRSPRASSSTPISATAIAAAKSRRHASSLD